MKVGVYSLGCKVNTYESEFVIHQLKTHGYEIAPFSDVCDVYIINTCTVTNTSDIKSRKIIHQAIKRNKDACIVVMGCFIQANLDYYEDGVDIVLGNQDKSKLVSLLDEYFQKKKPIRRVYRQLDTTFEDMFIPYFEDRTRAFVKIQDGCENFCSYCIIPFVRGKCRSKRKEEVIKEITSLIANGFSEIVLTGIHTGNYGRDLGLDFATLLKEIVLIKGLKRLRISSIEITELTDEVLALLQDYPVIVDHLHVPLQSGSDRILKAMNRKYDTKYFKDKIMQIRKIRPQISITTDVIVGFPGETDDLWQETLETIRTIHFSKVHVFPYSRRTGTVAARMDEQVDPLVKKARTKELLALSKELEETYFQQFLNQEVEVLIEKSHDGYSYGHTGNYLPIKLKGVYPSQTYVKGVIYRISYPYCEMEEEHTLIGVN